jgi:nucleotide-binding universal stress UspA family protein
MFRRILVTLDGSEFGEAAIPAAVGIARSSAAKLDLVSVQDVEWSMLRGESGEAGRGRVHRYLAGVKDRVAPIVPDVSVNVCEGHVVDEVLRAADDFGADLIVMATHGRGALSRFWLGSVAHQMIRRAYRPVLLVRPRELGAESRAGSLAVERVVVPLDGSRLAEAALRPALEIAGLFRSGVTLLRVVPEQQAPTSDLIPATFDVNAQMVSESREEASAYLDRLAARLRERGVQPDLAVPVRGQTADAILEAAGDGLIVMATHARTGLNRAFLGSVADSVVRSATGPVLVVPPEAEHAGGWGRHAREVPELRGVQGPRRGIPHIRR